MPDGQESSMRARANFFNDFKAICAVQSCAQKDSA